MFLQQVTVSTPTPMQLHHRVGSGHVLVATGERS